MKENKNYALLCELTPKRESDKIDWRELSQTPLGSVFSAMEKTPQNPKYHAEGNVFVHTVAVCDALVKQEAYLSAGERDKTVLLLGALLHDVGKPKTTRLENGNYTSPKHATVGALITRELLWREFGLAGDEDARDIRETVSALVKYHSFPPHAMEDKNPEYKLLKTAALGELAPTFNLSHLYLIEKADALGRISEDADDYLERIECFRLLAEELDLLGGPHKFKSPYSERAYFKKQTTWRDAELWQDSFGEVIMLSGLPGTGKDYYIKKNYPDMPVVSLDEIRARLGISPTANQGAVFAEAERLSRKLLRDKTPFVFNATNLHFDIRAKNVALFEDYGASVKTVFLETDLETELLRNSQREAEVPRAVIDRMLSRLEIPERHESCEVKWEIT